MIRLPSLLALAATAAACSPAKLVPATAPANPPGPASMTGGVRYPESGAPSPTAPPAASPSPTTPAPSPAPTPAPAACRSSLYPAGWAPGFADSAGRALPDFSYAGYHQGLDPLPDAPPGAVLEAAAGFGADGSGATNACPAIQRALDAAAAAGGGVVHLAAGTYRCQASDPSTVSGLADGRLRLRGSRVVLRGDGPGATFLYFAHAVPRDGYADVEVGPDDSLAGDYVFQRTPGPALAADAPAGATSVDVACAAGAPCLAAGDDVVLGWTVTNAFLAEHDALGSDGSVVDWAPIAGQYEPVFYRTVRSVEPVSGGALRLHLDVPLRAPARVRDGARVDRESGYVVEAGIEHLAIANAVPWADAWANNQRVAIAFAHTRDSWVRDVRSFASPWSALDARARGSHLQSCGLEVAASRAVTVDGCDLERAENTGGGGNGYLYWVSLSNEVLVRDSRGAWGRHHFTVGGTGLAGSGHVFLRDTSEGGSGQDGPDAAPYPTYSDFHDYLATANLVDGCTLRDGWIGVHNPGDFGQSATGCVFWNDAGGGMLDSYQFGWGYVIAPNDLQLHVALDDPALARYDYLAQGSQAQYTAPADFVECDGALPVAPDSLYEDQLARRRSQ